MDSSEFRCEGDQALHSSLLEVDQVKKVRKDVEENPSRSARRQLLATSLRLTRTMSPRLHTMLQSCAERLSVDIPMETYVYNSPQFNAACIKPEKGTLLLMFSSAILEKFDEQELLFVMGHELGHHLFAHHDIPIGLLVKGKDRVDARLALQLFSWSRYAEISADRAGALCAADPDASARALFKLASGLTSNLIEIRIDEFAAQADEIELYFVNLEDGATVSAPVTVVFGLRGKGVAPAGVDQDGTGHHHILLNRPPFGEWPNDTEISQIGIPADDHHIHFGGGQTETVLDLPAGSHSLQLLLGDHFHVPHDPVVASERITITVTE